LLPSLPAAVSSYCSMAMEQFSQHHKYTSSSHLPSRSHSPKENHGTKGEFDNTSLHKLMSSLCCRHEFTDRRI